MRFRIGSKKIPEGTFLRIPLGDGSFGYGRILVYTYIGFYDYYTTEPESDLDLISAKPFLFKLGVRLPIPERWTVLGRRDLAGDAAEPVVQFTQDVADFTKCTLFDSVGMEKRVRPEECVGIERAASWEAHQVEQRLLDRFMGRPNATEEHLRVRLSDDT